MAQVLWSRDPGLGTNSDLMPQGCFSRWPVSMHRLVGGCYHDMCRVCTDLWVGVIMTCAHPLSWTKPPFVASPLSGRMLTVIDIPQDKPWLHDHMSHGLWVGSKWHMVSMSTVLKLPAKRIQLNLAEANHYRRRRRHGAHLSSYTVRLSGFQTRKDMQQMSVR